MNNLSVNKISEIDNIEDLSIITQKVIDIDILTTNLGAGKNNALILLKDFLYNLILKQKKCIKIENNQKINLKRVFKRDFTSTKKLSRILKNPIDFNRNIGTVPHVFLDNVEDKKECAKKLFDLFAKYSLILNYDISHTVDITKVEVKLNTKDLENELSLLINKKVKVSFAGNGFFGNGFKISVFNNENTSKDFFYKVFFPYNKRNKHGADVEIVYAYFAMNNTRKNQFAKFHMGRMATPIEKDAFLLTNFIAKKQDKNNATPKSYTLSIDYLYSQDRRIDNKINGRIVDFGALREYAPELQNKTLRKIVRIISSRIKKSADRKHVIYAWQMSKNNCKSLKKYISKIKYNDYIKAVNIIKKYFRTLPQDYIKDLLNIKNWSDDHYINYKKALVTEDIITTNITQIKNNEKILDLKIKTSLDGMNNLFGYIMVDLYFDRQIIYFLDNENNVTKIRVEKQIDGKFVTLLELNGEEIAEYKNPDILSLIRS